MATETPIYTMQTQIPQVRRVSKLDDVKRVLSSKKNITAELKVSPEKKHRHLIVYLIIGIVFFGVFAFELAVIYKYDKLNKRLYQISVSLKNKVSSVQNKLQYANKQKEILGANKRAMSENYQILSSNHKLLKLNLVDVKNNYENLLAQKSGTISLLEGDMRVINAQSEAVKAQNELLSKELTDKNIYIEELTGKLVTNITQQENLLNENLKLKGECDRITQQVLIQSTAENTPQQQVGTALKGDKKLEDGGKPAKSLPVENKNVNK